MGVIGGRVLGPYLLAGGPARRHRGDFIDDVAESDIIAIDNDRRTDCTVWGDIMTQYAGLRRITATVIDGVCRDVAKALGDGYPLFTRGASCAPARIASRWQPMRAGLGAAVQN